MVFKDSNLRIDHYHFTKYVNLLANKKFTNSHVLLNFYDVLGFICVLTF